MHPTLSRLDLLATSLPTDPDVVAVLGLGSAGVETDRFDEHSDIDFFLVVDGAAAKRRYVEDVGWLAGFGGRVAWSFANEPNGRKALFEDGLFLEYGVFTPSELEAIPFAGARVVWSRPSFTVTERAPGPATTLDTVEFHLNEALGNLYVGLHRELRGERLTAMRFLQVHAVDRVLALQRLDPETTRVQPDPFEATRRVELSSGRALPLEEMVPGYGRNADAAAATLAWLRQHYDVDAFVAAAVEDLIERAR